MRKKSRNWGAIHDGWASVWRKKDAVSSMHSAADALQIHPKQNNPPATPAPPTKHSNNSSKNSTPVRDTQVTQPLQTSPKLSGDKSREALHSTKIKSETVEGDALRRLEEECKDDPRWKVRHPFSLIPIGFKKCDLTPRHVHLTPDKNLSTPFRKAYPHPDPTRIQ